MIVIVRKLFIQLTVYNLSLSARFRLSSLAVGILTGLFSQTAQAQQSVDWEVYKFRLVPSNKTLNEPMPGTAIFAQNHSNNKAMTAGSVAFVCVNSQLLVGMTYDAVDVKEAMKVLWNRNRMRLYRAGLEIGNQEGVYDDYSYSKKSRMVLPQDRPHLAKIYNAALTGKAVNLLFKGEKIPLSLPHPNPDFRNFGAACGVGLKASNQHAN